MKYFLISSGLRGCYVDDSQFIIAINSRRELKSTLESECDRSREAYGFGGSKAEIASAAAWAWREAQKRTGYLPLAIGFGRSRSTNDRPFGVFVNVASRAEYLGYLKQND